MNQENTTGTLFLLPTLLGECSVEKVIPEYNITIISKLRYFIVEEVRTARRFLKKSCPSVKIDDLHFLIFNEHTPPEMFSSFLEPLLNGHDTGLLSEAGLPCVADPGAAISQIAHEAGIRVCPLVGPSSLLLALMASGFNGQNFAFSGYLPIEKNARIKKLREIEQIIYTTGQTQIFIEAPYRNIQVFQAIVETCRENTLLCLASALTTNEEFVRVKPIKEWRGKNPDIQKKPTVFILSH